MAELIYDPALIGPDEPIFVLHVGQTGSAETIVASLDLEQVGPPAEHAAKPVLTGFDLPANDVLYKAHELAAEEGVRRILVADPFGMLRFAPVSRYSRRG
ncbi:MAG TPA: hypothetical protein VMG08_16290 [Allosphingosinicella sp.]|nr:hypothetical protein [Allosphingosinicella sp.]